MNSPLTNEDQGRYWERTNSKLPPENVIVDTMISDIGGARNKQRLYRRGRLWFLDDGSMYVYYTPTHWSELVPALLQTQEPT